MPANPDQGPYNWRYQAIDHAELGARALFLFSLSLSLSLSLLVWLLLGLGFVSWVEFIFIIDSLK
jgi:hypothetical protein